MWLPMQLASSLGGAALVALVALGGPAPIAAQVCTGDCDGHGTVGVTDLILAVNITLDRAPLESCPALGPGPIGIPALIASVGNALCDCRPCPAPLSTRTPTGTGTPTDTATPTATPSASPTPTGSTLITTWIEHSLKLPGSDCPKRLVTALRQQLRDQTSSFTVYERGSQSVVEDGSGQRHAATVDAERVLYIVSRTTTTDGACSVTVDLDGQIDLAAGLFTTATYRGTLRSVACARPVDCSLHITSRWQRTYVLPQYTPGPFFPRPQYTPGPSFPGSWYGSGYIGGLTFTWSDGGYLYWPTPTPHP